MRIIISTLAIFILSSCRTTSSTEPLYPLPTIILEQGQTTSINLRNFFASEVTSITVPGHPFFEITFYSNNDSLVISPKPDAPKLASMPFIINNQTQNILVRVQPLVAWTFTYKPLGKEHKVVVMGGFNDWSRTALPLDYDASDGLFKRTVYLKPERHEYKFVIDGEEKIDPANPVFISNNIGGWNSILDLSDRKETPAGRYAKKSVSGGKLWFDFIPSTDGALPGLPFVTFNNTIMHNDDFDPLENHGLKINLRKLKNGVLRITGLDETGRVIDDNITIIRDGKPLDTKEHKGDWYFTVLYNLMTDRFLDGDPSNTVRVVNPELRDIANWQGGDFAGITQKLKEGYFTDLGINSIWITPVQRQPDLAWRESISPNRYYTGYHGYWPIAARETDPRFGSGEELKELVETAHRLGIKVLLDFVSNHVHQEHAYFSEHPDWFGDVQRPDGTLNIRNWSEETRLTTWFDTFLPSYDYPNSQDAIDQVVSDAIWWLDTYNLDGFRQDAVKHVPHLFWQQLTAELKRQFPGKEVYQIGETFGSDALIGSYVNPGELSAQFNFAIYFNARNQFAANEADFSHLAEVITDNALAFGGVNLMGNITSSHDQLKFMAVADGQIGWGYNGTELAFTKPPRPAQSETPFLKLGNFQAFNISIAGIPIVYYGEEIGLMGAADPDNRRPMKFGDDVSEFGNRLRKTYAALNRLRTEHPSLALGDLITVLQDGPLWVYEKRYFNERILIVFNHSATSKLVDIQLESEINSVNSLLDESIITLVNGEIKLTAEPYSHYFYLMH